MPLRRDLTVRERLHLRTVGNERTCSVRWKRHPFQRSFFMDQPTPARDPHAPGDDDQPHHPCRIQDFRQYDAGRTWVLQCLSTAGWV
jgi:hypothetical protein